MQSATLAERQHVRGVTCCHPPPFPLGDPRSSNITNVLGFKQNCPQPFLSTRTTPSCCSQSRGSPVACVGCWLGPCCLELLRRRCWRGLRNLHSGGAASQDSVGSGGGPRSSTLHVPIVPPSPHLTNPKTMRAVLVAVLGVAGQLSATPSPQSVNPSGPPTEHQPSTKVVENDRYYTLSVYQNNAGNSFEDNLINMDSAELKKGEKQLLNWFGLHFVQEMDKSGPPTASGLGNLPENGWALLDCGFNFSPCLAFLHFAFAPHLGNLREQ